jgi:hypothetical protein
VSDRARVIVLEMDDEFSASLPKIHSNREGKVIYLFGNFNV